MNYPSNHVNAGGLSPEAKRALGPTHIVWSCSYLGDLTAAKTRVINEMAAEGYSDGWIQAIANWPTQAQEVILRLVIEKKMSAKEITKKTGFKIAHTTATTTIARKLGFLPKANDRLAGIREARVAKLAEARRALKAARDNPGAALEVMAIEKGNRHAVRPNMNDAIAKAAGLLTAQPEPVDVNGNDASSKAEKLRLAEAVLKGEEPMAQVTQAQVDALAALPEVDPSKRTVRVTLDLTLEELSDFSAAVARKRAAEQQA